MVITFEADDFWISLQALWTTKSGRPCPKVICVAHPNQKRLYKIIGKLATSVRYQQLANLQTQQSVQ